MKINIMNITNIQSNFDWYYGKYGITVMIIFFQKSIKNIYSKII